MRCHFLGGETQNGFPVSLRVQSLPVKNQFLHISSKKFCLRMNTYLGGGDRHRWLLLDHPALWYAKILKRITEIFKTDYRNFKILHVHSQQANKKSEANNTF